MALCHCLEGEWHEAYVWSERVLAQARTLHAEDPRTRLAARLTECAKSGEVNLTDARIAIAAQIGVDASRMAGSLADWHQETQRRTRPGRAMERLQQEKPAP